MTRLTALWLRSPLTEAVMGHKNCVLSSRSLNTAVQLAGDRALKGPRTRPANAGKTLVTVAVCESGKSHDGLSLFTSQCGGLTRLGATQDRREY